MTQPTNKAGNHNHQVAAYYANAVGWVLSQTDTTARTWYGRRTRLPNGVPYQIAGKPVIGPQCVTVSVQIRDEDLNKILGLSERFAMTAQSAFARVYRDLGLARVEFTLPSNQWRVVRLDELPHRPNSATIGQKALGPAARVSWDTPHKAVFGSTQSGKTTCLADFILSLARTNKPDDYRLLILNPKNDRALHPFGRLAHLAAPIANDYDDAVLLLRYALAEMEKRRCDPERQRQASRWVVIVDEVAQLVEAAPTAGAIITQLSQMAGGFRINLIVASQAANPSVFGEKGSLARANFPSRIVFRLPSDQSYLATGLANQHTERLGGKGDGLAISSEKVTRFRAAMPQRRDFDVLTFTHSIPDIAVDDLAGDAAIQENGWQVEPEMVAYALLVRNTATQIRKHFGVGTDKARTVRDYATALTRAALALRRQIETERQQMAQGLPATTPTLFPDLNTNGRGESSQ